jgi:predicted O-methyltransferase YrrM
MRFDYPDWSTIHQPYWKGLMERIDFSDPIYMLEVGCFEGRTTVWLADYLKHHPDSKLHCIDHWQGGEEVARKNLLFNMGRIRENFFYNISMLPMSNKVFIHDTDSRKGMSSLVSTMYGMFHYIYLDGSHTQQDTLFDLTLALCLIRQNGIIVVDDYKNNMATSDTRLRPVKAVDFIVNTMHHDVEFFVTKERQAVIIKR